MTVELFSIGHLLVETLKYPERSIGPVLGGPVSYSAITASALGMKSGVVTKVGSDILQVLIKADFFRPYFDHSVDTGGIIVDGTDSLWLENAYDRLGNKVLTISKKPPSILFKDIPKEYLSAKGVHVSPIADEVPIETTEALHGLDAVLSVDLGGYLGGYFSTGTTEERLEFTKHIVKHFDVVKASLEDIRNLRTKGASIEDCAHLFLNWGAKVSIITLGEKGSFVMTEQTQESIPAFPVEQVSEKGAVGAGDAYSGSFLVEYVRTKDAVNSAWFASAAASYLCGGRGMESHFATSKEVYEKISKLRKS
jgi:sugar/nucleoside kinase (ribokinase family)